MDGLSHDPAFNDSSFPKRALGILPFHHNLGENWIAYLDLPRIDRAHQPNLEWNAVRASGVVKRKQENE